MNKRSTLTALNKLITKSGYFNSREYMHNEEYYSNAINSLFGMRSNHDLSVIQKFSILHTSQTEEEITCACGKLKSRFSFRAGFIGKYCSLTCHNKEPKISSVEKEELRVKKIKETKLLRYGDENYNNTNKQKETIKIKYPNLSDIRSKQMLKRTVYEKESFIRKIKETKLLRYGDENYNNSRSHILKHKQHILKDELFIRDEFVKSGFFLSNEFDNFFGTSQTLRDNLKKNMEIFEPNKKTFGITQKKIFDLVSVYHPVGAKFNDRFKHEGRMVEFDITLPHYKTHIEYNGMMFHSHGKSNYTMFNNPIDDPKYHLSKTVISEELGYQLFHIFESEWLDPIKKGIWESVLLNKMGISEKIYARKCEVKEVSPKEASSFLNLNHLQGSSVASIRVGLFYNKELVSLMTFGKARFNKHHEYELIRFCSKLNFTVVGGASRLLKYFEKMYEPKSLMSYANRRWSQGNLYEKIGFEFTHTTSPNYFYFKPDSLVLGSRNKYQKHKLKDILDNFDPELTETENMYNNGFRKIFDSGSKVYKKHYSK